MCSPALFISFALALAASIAKARVHSQWRSQEFATGGVKAIVLPPSLFPSLPFTSPFPFLFLLAFPFPLHRWNLRLMLNISYAGYLDLSRMVSAQFTLKMCITAWNHEKITKNIYFGGSRSFKVIDVGTAGKLVSSACHDKQQVCVCLQPFSR